MVKKGPLNKMEKFYIENHVETLTVAELSKELDRSENTVKNYINKLPNKKPKEDKKKKEDKPKPKKHRSKMDELMGHKERNEQRVATIMTPAASEYSDSKRGQNQRNTKLNSAIHKPKG